MTAANSALIAHIVSQTRQNVEFLLEHRHISQADATAILSRLEGPLANGGASEKAAPVYQAPTSTPPQSSARCKALWDYKGEAQDDLSFQAGDILTIVEENNEHWWTGSCKGKTGLFPASYVEKLASAPAAKDPTKPAYRPFGAAYHGMDTPPPANQNAVNSVGLQEDPGQEKKKGKFGKYGNTMAHSAAGGVGFGAGAAIGGGLVRAIF